MKYEVVKRDKNTAAVVESVKKFASKAAACKFCRKMNGTLTLESKLRKFYFTLAA